MYTFRGILLRWQMILPLSYWHCLGISCLSPCCIFYQRVPFSARGVWGHGRHIFIINTCTRTHKKTKKHSKAILDVCKPPLHACLNFYHHCKLVGSQWILTYNTFWLKYLPDWCSLIPDWGNWIPCCQNERWLWALLLSGMRKLRTQCCWMLFVVWVTFSFLINFTTLF